MKAWGFPALLAVVLFGVHVWLFSDSVWIEALLLEHEQASIRAGEETGSEEARQAMRAALESGAIGILLGARAIWTLTKSHLIFWGLNLPVILLIAGRWDRLRELWSIVGAGMWILAAGVVMNALLRWLVLRMQATWSPAFFLDWFDGRLPLHDLAIKADLFLFLYFGIISRRWSSILGESPLLIGGITVLSWLLITLLTHALSYTFTLTY